MTFTWVKNDFASITDFRDDNPGLEPTEAAVYVLYADGETTCWYLYELTPGSPYYDRGAYGFQADCDEPQFATLHAAQTALIAHYIESAGPIA